MFSKKGKDMRKNQSSEGRKEAKKGSSEEMRVACKHRQL